MSLASVRLSVTRKAYPHLDTLKVPTKVVDLGDTELYQVLGGDTLYSIANKYGITLKERAIISLALIAVVLGQEPKSGGLGGMDGSSDAVFSGKARGMDALLARVTVISAICFGVVTLIIAKWTS